MTRFMTRFMSSLCPVYVYVALSAESPHPLTHLQLTRARPRPGPAWIKLEGLGQGRDGPGRSIRVGLHPLYLQTLTLTNTP